MVCSVLETTHVRARDMSASRMAAFSVSSTVRLRVNALPRELSSEMGTRTASSSSTRQGPPSSAKSRRAENRCWWNGAPSPGAISEAKSEEPLGRAEVKTTPVALASNSMVPSR